MFVVIETKIYAFIFSGYLYLSSVQQIRIIFSLTFQVGHADIMPVVFLLREMSLERMHTHSKSSALP